jgi:hypothetical protein
MSDPPDKNGTRDGVGSGDHNTAYSFGTRLTAQSYFPFTARQFACLLCLRSHVQDEGVPPARAERATVE